MTETTVNRGETQQIQGFAEHPNYGTHSENSPNWAEINPEISFSEAQKIIEGYQDENFVLLESWQNRISALNAFLGAAPLLPTVWYAFSDLLFGVILSVVLYTLAYLMYKRGQSFLEAKTIECYANIKDNIYVYHEHENDRTVLKRKKKHVEMLEKANNLTPLPVKVIDIYFGIGEHCNETWNGEWPGRLIREVQKDRSTRHKKLAKDYPLLYKKYILKQEME